MAAVKVECSACLAQLTLKSRDKLGKKLKCPKCGEVFVAKPVKDSAAVDDDDDMFGDLGDDMELLGAGGSTGQRKKSSTGKSGSPKSSKTKKSGGKSKKKKSKGQSAGDSKRTMLIAGIGGGVLVTALAIWGVIALMGDKKSDNDGNQTAQNGMEQPPVDPAMVPNGGGNPNAKTQSANQAVAKKNTTKTPAPKGNGGKTTGNKQAGKKPSKPQPNLNAQQALKEMQSLASRISQLKAPADDKLIAEAKAAVARAKQVLAQKQPKETALIPGLYRAATVLRGQWVDKARSINVGKEPLRLVQTIWERSQTNDPIEQAYAAYAYELLGDLVQAEATPPEVRMKEADKLYTTAHDILKPIANTNAAYPKKVQDILSKLISVRAAAAKPVAKKPNKQPNGVNGKPAGKGPTLPAETAMTRKLPRPIELVDATLTDAVKMFASVSNTPIIIDNLSLSDEGISTDIPVTTKAVGITGDELSKLLKPLKLAWTIRHGVVYVTTQRRSETLLESRVYQVKGAGALVNRIMKQGLKAAWQSTDGVGGTMVVIGRDILVIRQTWTVLGAIERQFAKELNRSKLPEFSTDFEMKGTKLPGVLFSKKIEVHFVAHPLKNAVHHLSELTKVPMIIDERALANEGISTDSPVKLQLNGLATADVLSLLLDPLSLTWVPTSKGIQITTKSAAETKLVTATHRIDVPVDQSFVVAIQNATSGRWQSVGGVGGTIRISGQRSFEVRQPLRVQLEIARLLAPFRKSGK